MPDVNGLLFRQCRRKGCINRGVWGMKICVPAVGQRAFEYPPLTCLANFVVCESHVRDVRYEDFATPELENRFRAYAKERGLRQPDFSRGYMDGVPVTDKEWQKFESSLSSGAVAPNGNGILLPKNSA